MQEVKEADKKLARKLWCYSLEGFNRVMESMDLKRSGNEWLVDANNMAVISICTSGTSEEHYFMTGTSHILNIRFDDIDPDTWHQDGFDLDNASPADFVYAREREDEGNFTHYSYALNPVQAKKIVDFIDSNLGRDFYIHCSAGVSRSQGVVRYILDTYDEYIWQIRKDNPPFAPNYHVVRMLKRAKREKDNK